MLTVFVGAAIAFLVAMSLIPGTRWIADRLGAVDEPGGRRIHSTPIPRLGGIAIFGGFAIALSTMSANYPDLISSRATFPILFGAPLALLIGLWDDWKGIGAKRKLSAQLILGALAFFSGFRLEYFHFGTHETLSLGILSFPITLLWIAGVMNAVNLIDGMDGLAGGIISIVLMTIGSVATATGNVPVGLMAWMVAGAALGFLRFNFSPAKIFMGDGGSMFLGFVVSILSLSIFPAGTEVTPVFFPILLLAFPIVDTLVAILRRTIRAAETEASTPTRRKLKEIARVVFTADGDHIHHRLLDRGYSQRKSVLILYAFSAAAALVGVVLIYLPSMMSWALFALSVYTVSQLVLQLDYIEFYPRRVRQRLFQDRAVVGEQPALIRRVPG